MVDTYRGKTKDELLAEIDAAWRRLMATMTAHPPEVYTATRDDAGWTALDHLAHLTAWERSVLYPLQGRTRHEALGVSDEEFREKDFDVLNQVVRERNPVATYDEALAEAREVHAAVVAAVEATELDTLWRPSRELAQDTRETRREVPFMEILMSDASSHFDDHREYIERLLATT